GRRARGAPGARGYRRPAPAPVRAVSPIVVTVPAPVPQYDPQYEPQYAPAPLVYGAEPASPAYEAPVSAQSQGLGAAPAATGPVAADTAPGASPLVTPPPMLVPSAPAVTEEAHAASSWFQGLKLRGSFSQWDYAPIDDKPEPVFAEGRTSEVYDIEPLRLYRFDAELFTRYARIGLTYESNRGLDVGPGLGDLFGLFVAATGVPVLDRFSLVARTLDFEHGHVTLLDAQTGETVERAPFRVEMTDIDLRYAFSANGFLFGEYLGYALPRNVYLQMGNGATEPLQISDQLLKVEQRLFSVGLGLQWPDDGEGFHGALSGSLGMGDYDLRTVNGGAFLDHGDLFGAQLGGRLGYRLPLTSTLSLGVRDELTVRWLDPLGLPDGVRRDLRGQGVDLTDLSLTFGVTELINTVTVDLTLSI
ncbi:MAG: hypothetical protein KC620_24255, partial [Myxococcales bacterium]|nr:hypothetical protein [Myxococcales bacterium]